MKQKNLYTPEAFTIGALFFICGLVTWLNATIIPFLKVACELSNFQSYFVTFAFYLAYAAVALPSLRLLEKTDTKSGMAMGLMAMSAGALIFVPAALLRTYPLFLLGLLASGAGLGLLQAAVSTYIAAPGTDENAPSGSSVANICSRVAGVAGTLAVGSVLFYKIDSFEASIRIAEGVSRAAELDTLAHKAVAPYLAIALALAAVAFWVKSLPRPTLNAGEKCTEQEKDTPDVDTFRLPRFWLGLLTLFLYVGAEVIGVGSISLYGKAVGMSFEVAKALPACWLFAALLGCLLGAFVVPRHICMERALAVCAALGVIFSVAAVNATGWLSVAFVALLGLSGSLVWPSVFSLSMKKMGKYAKLGAAILATGVAGGALLPLAYGYLADAAGYRQAYWILAPCYAAILLYAITNLPSAKKKHQSGIIQNMKEKAYALHR
ncbi:MAG: MFS transporter [Prevotellaceae bacterium]|jgi:fucose permease|nr:MFS transporter [Prevotellaceae bacterium]